MLYSVKVTGSHQEILEIFIKKRSGKNPTPEMVSPGGERPLVFGIQSLFYTKKANYLSCLEMTLRVPTYVWNHHQYLFKGTLIYAFLRQTMSHFTFRNFPRDLYGMFTYIHEEPRISLSEIARRMQIDKRTASAWWKIAVENGIIVPPVLRRKSFLNFREYVYFLKVKDPAKLFEKLKESTEIIYYMVQTGFSNFGITSKNPIDPPDDVVLSGERSDYCLSIPPNCSFEKSLEVIQEKLTVLKDVELKPSPLVYHDSFYEPWDEKDEILYWEYYYNMRKPLSSVMRENQIYSDKIMNWIRRRNEFGQILMFYFPEGERTYLPSIYVLKTDYDSVVIDLFSQLPVSSAFYRVGGCLVMTLYVPFRLIVRSSVRNVLSRLQEEALVEEYDNTIVEYHYRP